MEYYYVRNLKKLGLFVLLPLQLGCVDQRTIHKYKQESARSGKASFAFAWVLDETEEER